MIKLEVKSDTTDLKMVTVKTSKISEQEERAEACGLAETTLSFHLTVREISHIFLLFTETRKMWNTC